MSDRQNELDQLSINALRFLAVDGIEKAKCGHPGAPLGCAPIAYLLYHKLMKHDPADPKWIDRDRFVLSNGHASMLLYGSLHLSGYDLPMAQLEQFRQWGSETPGHPERGDTPGVEVTTGPLGQGFGMAVGMAAAERHLAAVYNRDGHAVVDHHTYVLCGDGDLMEGVSHETASLAGTLGLGKLIVLYDDNLISLDGPTSLSYTEDVTLALRGVQLAGAERGRWQRPGGDRGRDQGGEGGDDAADAGPGAHGDWVRKPEGRNEQGPRRGPGNGGGAGDQEEPGLARGQELLCAG